MIFLKQELTFLEKKALVVYDRNNAELNHDEHILKTEKCVKLMIDQRVRVKKKKKPTMRIKIVRKEISCYPVTD